MKLGDFGLAKVMPNRQRPIEPLQMTGGIGTWRYMAPEVVRDEPYDEKIDIYGLGLIMYYLFSGRPPFFSVGKDPRPVLRAYRRGHEPRPSLRGLSKALRGFLPRGEIGPN